MTIVTLFLANMNPLWKTWAAFGGCSWKLHNGYEQSVLAVDDCWRLVLDLNGYSGYHQTLYGVPFLIMFYPCGRFLVHDSVYQRRLLNINSGDWWTWKKKNFEQNCHLHPVSYISDERNVSTNCFITLVESSLQIMTLTHVNPPAGVGWNH